MKQVILALAILIVGAATIFSLLGRRPAGNAPAQSAGAKASSRERALTPPWPPATDQRSPYQGPFCEELLHSARCIRQHERPRLFRQPEQDAGRQDGARGVRGVGAGGRHIGLQIFDQQGGTTPRSRDGKPREFHPAPTLGGRAWHAFVRFRLLRPTPNSRTRPAGSWLRPITICGRQRRRANPGQDPTPAIDRLLNESPACWHTIGFCIGSSHSLNPPRSATIYKAADNPGALQQGLARRAGRGAAVFRPEIQVRRSTSRSMNVHARAPSRSLRSGCRHAHVQSTAWPLVQERRQRETSDARDTKARMVVGVTTGSAIPLCSPT